MSPEASPGAGASRGARQLPGVKPLKAHSGELLQQFTGPREQFVERRIRVLAPVADLLAERLKARDVDVLAIDEIAKLVELCAKGGHRIAEGHLHAVAVCDPLLDEYDVGPVGDRSEKRKCTFRSVRHGHEPRRRGTSPQGCFARQKCRRLPDGRIADVSHGTAHVRDLRFLRSDAPTEVLKFSSRWPPACSALPPCPAPA